jgi:hypothetical protein
MKPGDDSDQRRSKTCRAAYIIAFMLVPCGTRVSGTKLIHQVSDTYNHPAALLEKDSTLMRKTEHYRFGNTPLGQYSFLPPAYF